MRLVDDKAVNDCPWKFYKCQVDDSDVDHASHPLPRQQSPRLWFLTVRTPRVPRVKTVLCIGQSSWRTKTVGSGSLGVFFCMPQHCVMHDPIITIPRPRRFVDMPHTVGAYVAGPQRIKTNSSSLRKQTDVDWVIVRLAKTIPIVGSLHSMSQDSDLTKALSAVQKLAGRAWGTGGSRSLSSILS